MRSPRKQRIKRGDKEVEVIVNPKVFDVKGRVQKSKATPPKRVHGEMTVHKRALGDLLKQGETICDEPITAYLNALTLHCFCDNDRSSEVYRCDTTFWRSLNCLLAQGHTVEEAWEELPSFQSEGCVNDWANFDSLIIPIFVGARECGHWSVLVCDRRVNRAGHLIWFDSHPEFSKVGLSFEQLKNVILQTPIACDDSTWMEARCPLQGYRTMVRRLALELSICHPIRFTPSSYTRLPVFNCGYC